MGSRLFTTTLFFCCVVGCFAHGSGEAGTCHSMVSAIREVLDGRTELPDTCTNCQGRPGKRGGVGPRGPIGPRGVEGRPGACKCELSAEQFNAKMIVHMRENHADYPGACYAGVSTGKIPLSDISASSTHAICPLQNVVLNSAKAWCAATNDVHQWIQVDQRTPRQVTGVLTQGRKDNDNGNQFVKTYQISYGDDLEDMTIYQEDGHAKIFIGNSEQHSAVMNVFSQPITARYFRIHPVTYTNHISMRIELLTC